MNPVRLAPIFGIVLLFACAPSPRAPEAPKPAETPKAQEPPKRSEKEMREAKEKKVRKLMELTGVAEVSKQTMTDMITTASKSGQLPPRFLEKFKELADVNGIIDLIVPVYMKHLEEKDLDAAIVFYQSAEGANFTKATPTIMKECQEAGERWGQELAMKVLQALQDDQDQEEEQEEEPREKDKPKEEGKQEH